MVSFLKSKVHLGALWGILIVLAITIGLITCLINQYVTHYVRENYVSSLRAETDSFELALQEGLVLHNFNLVQQLLADLGLQKSIRAIRLLNSSGVVRASSIAGEVGVQLNRNSQPCQVCHLASGEMMPFYQLIPGKDTEGSTIVIANALNNRVICQGCHTDGKPTRGVLLVEYHAQDMQNWQQNFSLLTYSGGVFVFLLLFGALAFVFHFNVSLPLQSLAYGAPEERLVERSDGIGVVARRLLDMGNVQRQQESQADIMSRNFRALASISASLDESISVDRIFRTALSTIQDVTGFSTVAMRYFDASQDCFRLVVQNGMSARMVKELRCITPEFPLYKILMESRRVIYISVDQTQALLQIHPSSQAEGYYTTLCVPLLSGDRILGSMELGSKTPLTFSEDQIHWLEIVGRVIGGLLHQVELLDRLRGMAMLQERAYVAQEIHDGLVQMLGSLRLWAEEAQMAVDEGDMKTVQSAVRKIESTSSDAYSSLREEMLGLRETLQTGKGILPVVNEFLKRFQRQWGIETKLLVEDQDATDIAVLSSPAVEIQLLRMIQEGLTNVRRHSRATRVQVQFHGRDHKLEVEISDNGVGFDQNNIPEDKLGLRIMRERAAQIGGKVSVETAPGQGTHLKIEVPR